MKSRSYLETHSKNQCANWENSCANWGVFQLVGSHLFRYQDRFIAKSSDISEITVLMMTHRWPSVFVVVCHCHYHILLLQCSVFRVESCIRFSWFYTLSESSMLPRVDQFWSAFLNYVFLKMWHILRQRSWVSDVSDSRNSSSRTR